MRSARGKGKIPRLLAPYVITYDDCMPLRLVPPPEAAAEREAIRAQAQALALRARRAGLGFAACLFEFAVFELNWQRDEKPTPR
jgi:hypothetical protein